MKKWKVYQEEKIIKQEIDPTMEIPLDENGTTTNPVEFFQNFNAEIERAIDKIKEGSRITDAFRDSVIVNQMILGMLSAGEASDNIPGMVNKIADILDEDVNAAIQKFSTLLTESLKKIN